MSKLKQPKEFKIESGVPMKRSLSRYTAYPFGRMKVGDSFLIPTTDNAEKYQVQTNVLGAVRRAGGGIKITTRREEAGVRVWRIA